MTKYFSEIFTRDNKRCVYCGRDLMVDFETWMLTQEDHLVPLAKHGADDATNRVVACYTCNKLKSDYVPPGFTLPPTDRTAYINAVRDHIMVRRSKWMKDFATWTHSGDGIPKDLPK